MRNRLPLSLLVGCALAVSVSACGDTPGSSDDLDTSTGDTDVSTGDVSDDASDDATDDAGPDAADTASDAGEDTTPDAEPDADEDVAPDGSGELPCADDQCDIDGECFDNGTANPDNPCEVCRVLTDAAGWSFDDAATCDDGDACTGDDACFEGTCMGTIAACDDGNACTAGLCDPEDGSCTYENVEGACDDGDPCTVGETCGDGTCGGGDAVACDDGDPCTADRCEPGVGCVSEPLSDVACDDGDPCTVGDVCTEGLCLPGEEPLACDDGSLCTVDRCIPGVGCDSVSIADRCADDNPCTDELCDPDQGCVYPFNSNPCDDGSLCTVADVCTEGACRGTPLSVDDDNACTDDSCDPATGPVSVPNTDACDDGNLCTVGDVCVDGGCEAGTDALDCDDGNFCTANSCDPELGCVTENLTIACDDGNACTTADTCGGGSCDGAPVDCDDGNACTADACDPELGCTHTVVLSNECRPTIVVDFPPRAATLDSDDGALVVTGSVVSGAGAITSFTINGVDVAVDGDGRFAYTPAPIVGGNVLSFAAEDELGSTRKRVQSYLWTSSYLAPVAGDADTRVDPGMGIRLAAEAFGVFSDIFEIVIANYPIGELLVAQPQPLASVSGYDISATDPNGVTLGAATVVVSPRTGGLALDAEFAGLSATLSIEGFLCGGTVTYTASRVTLDADINLSVANHEPVATFTNVVADVQGGDLQVDCAIGFLVEAFAGDLSGDIEGLLQDTVRDQFGPLISDAFTAFAINADLPLPAIDPTAEPVVITLGTDFSRIDSNPTGTNFVLRAGATTPETRTPYSNSGSLLRNGCGAGGQDVIFPSTDPLEVALADDLVNQILYSAWDGGFLEFDVPPELLGDFAIPGVENLTLFASGMLQPTASDCASIDGPLVAQIGDLRIDASLDLFGQPLDLVIYVAVQAEVSVTAADGELGFGLGNLSDPQIEVNVVQENLISAEATFEALLLDQLIPGLEAALGGGALGTFPLPEIDLSEAVGSPEPIILSIVPNDVVRSAGNTVILGVLE